MNRITEAVSASRSRLAGRIEELGPWFHNLDLDGIETAPNHFLGDYPRSKFASFAGHLPDDLSGRTVLDIGCNAGFYAIEMKRRGADRVVAIDHDPRYLAQARLAFEVFGADIELRQLDVYNVGAIGARFDIVLFLGVVYHLRHPLLALDLIHEHVADDLLVFQSLQRGSEEVLEVPEDAPFSATEMFDAPGFPVLHFVEHAYAGDGTNWWIPNRAASEAMLRSAGFKVDLRATGDVLICRSDRSRKDSGAVYPSRGKVPAS